MEKKLNKNLLDFLNKAKILNKNIYALQNDASKRVYYRGLDEKRQLLLMDSSLEKKSLRNFLNIASWLQAKGYSSPKIYNKNISKGYCILEDFGETKFSNIRKNNINKKYKLTINLLASLSKLKPPVNLKYYSRNIFMKELNLFIKWYLSHNQYKNESSLVSWKNIWHSLFQKIENHNNKTIVLRDIHIDNLFWLENRENTKKIGLIDFQDALIGHPCYDLVSLLQDVRINISKKEQLKLYNYYISINNVDKKNFEEAYFIFGTQRLIKIIGVFYRLKYLYKKNNYMEYIPRTWLLLKNNLKFPPLKELSLWFQNNVFKKKKNK